MPQARIGETNIIDGLDSTDGFSALSANMGRVLDEKIQALDERVQDLESGSGSGSDTTHIPATDAEIDALFN